MKKSRAAVRTVRILDLIAKETKGLSLSEIAKALEIPVTSASDIVRALLDEGMIEVIDERSKVYGIGVKAFFIGNSFLVNTSLIDKAKGELEKLSHLLGRTVFLGKEVNGKITYIYKHEPKETLVATCGIGSQTNLHCTSLGKSMLAFDQSLLERLDSSSLVQRTKHTVTDYDLLLKELEKVRQCGFAVDDREQNEHLFCVGAPVFDNHRKVVAAVSISGLYKGSENVDELGAAVKATAMSISRALGYH